MTDISVKAPDVTTVYKATYNWQPYTSIYILDIQISQKFVSGDPNKSSLKSDKSGFIATDFFKIPWYFPDSIHISLTKCNNKIFYDRF